MSDFKIEDLRIGQKVWHKEKKEESEIFGSSWIKPQVIMMYV